MAGSVCTLCPSQCNVSFTVRDERVLRVNARDNHDVDDGWLCDKGRFAYQAVHVDERVTEPMVRDGGELRPVSWERALTEAAGGLKRASGSVGALAGGETTNEEAFLVQRVLREALDSGSLDFRRTPVPADVHRAIGRPGLGATVPDLEFAHAVLVLDCEPVDEMPIVDLRIRKGVRRNHVRLAVATSRPSTLDPNAELSVRFAPGQGAAFAEALAGALSDEPYEARANAAGADAAQIGALAELLRGAGEDIVILFGERVLGGAHALSKLADGLGLRDRPGAGLLQVPGATNGRGLAEVGFLPDAGPGLATPQATGLDTAGMSEGSLTALWLLHTDPLRDMPDRAAWDAALGNATTVVAHAAFLTDGIREHATVVFPAESHAEKDGTITHPDGRVQRLRPAIGHQGDSRFEWQVIADVARRLGLDLGVHTAGMAFQQLTQAVPFYAGLTLDEIGGRGVRWPETDAAATFPAPEHAPEAPAPGPVAQVDGQALRLGTFRPLWASPEVAVSPSLQFLVPHQRVEMSPDDARKIGVTDGERVRVGTNGTRVNATVSLRAAVPPGSVFLLEALEGDDSGNLLTGPTVYVERAS
jgi:NADH-quinone oxidoreductase subunit G